MASLRVIDGNYVADWRDKAGKRHRDILGPIDVYPRKKAEEFVGHLNLEASPGYELLNLRRVCTVAEFVARYLPWHACEYPASTWRVESAVRLQFLPAFEYLRLDQLDSQRVDAWKHRRLGQVKPQTVAKELRILKAVLNKAVEWDELPRSPARHVKPPRDLNSAPRRWYTGEELTSIYDACRAEVNKGEGPQPNPLHAHWWRLYANTGLRRTEGLILKRAWIGREEMKILSTEEARTKSGKWRVVPLSDGALHALDALPQDTYVLPRINVRSLTRAFQRDLDRSGVVGGTLHSLRHTYCSHLVMAGVPLRTVQELAGHSRLEVTERYAHLSPGHLAGAARAISL